MTTTQTQSQPSTLRAFHGDAKIKAKYLKRVRAHRKADEIVHGQYWQDGKGCAVGCTVHSNNHNAYETELGIPEVLAQLEDGIFESLDNGKALEWPERFLSAVRVGADLSKVWPRFAVWLMVDSEWGVLRWTKSDGAKKAIQDVADAYQSVADGTKRQEDIDWIVLRHAAAAAADAAYADAAAADAAYADAAAAYAAYAAAAYAAADAAAYADAAAAYAADAAAYAAAYAAAAYAAAYAAAAYAAAAARIGKRQSARIAQSDKLIELLKAAKLKLSPALADDPTDGSEP